MENYRPWLMRSLRSGNRVAFGSTAVGPCVAVLLVLGLTRASLGDPTQFTLNTAQSSLKLTGQVAGPLGPVALKPQVTGSDTATYTGFLSANLSAGGIQFPGGSSVAANNFVGSALTPDNPANYGMKATIIISTANATVINLVFDLGSGALAVAPDGTFPANMGTTATVTSGIIDYVAPPPYGNGTDSLAGSTASNQATTSATLAIVGQTQTLTIPISATIPFTAINPNDSTATFTGKLVATNTLTTPAVAYWRGDLDTTWSTMQPTAATNWRKDAAGANETLGLPGATTDVFFTTSGGGSNLSTILGANYSIKGLTFTSAANSPVSIGGANILTLGADGATSQSGASAAAISCPVVLGASQTWTANSSNPLTVAGSFSLGSNALTKSGAGVVVLSGAQSFGNNSAMNVSGGTLRYSATSNAASVGSAVSVHVAAGAEVELANSGSALSDGMHVANLTNDSQLPAGGLLVSGTNQRVGRIQGGGNVVVAAGGSLIANSIQQNSLVIGGSGGSHSLVTIAPSDASGNPLVESAPAPIATSNSIATGVSGADGPFAAGLGNATNLLRLTESATSLGDSQFMQLASATAVSPFAVPEPSGLLLIAVGLATLTAVISAKRIASRPFATSAGRPAV
jgi:autotransporter-associated beta strand protein